MSLANTFHDTFKYQSFKYTLTDSLETYMDKTKEVFGNWGRLIQRAIKDKRLRFKVVCCFWN